MYINDFHNCCSLFDFHIFVDDTNLFCSNSSLLTLESSINENLGYIFKYAFLNINKTNFIIFHPAQKITHHTTRLFINNKEIKQEKCIKYLGISIDSHLSWKSHILHISKKIKRCIGILSKIRHFVSTQILTQLYYTLIYPFLTYTLVTWGNTYSTSLKPLVTLQKKAVRIITFSDYNAHSSPLFLSLGMLNFRACSDEGPTLETSAHNHFHSVKLIHINLKLIHYTLKFTDLIFIHNALFMYDFYSNRLPPTFSDFFRSVSGVHQYNTRLARKKSYYLPKIRTNYGKFNVRYIGVKVWNSIHEDFKSNSRSCFKRLLAKSFLNLY